ncbi:thioredoxin-related transmembrane protein 2-like [Zingiber officinale]|uniref:thioredoxin-related transmembrane protein 2-like n=1 Tax=Zingiber officinale TaxID=94328 RepID=UPI001C4BEA04|nr:thioredoxin-related transmembrane protein 2-like [Zingiber officinale]
MEAMRSAPAIARSGHPFPWLNLMVTEPFYLLHVLLFCSYFAARSSSVQSLPSDLSNHLIHREIQAFLAFLVLLVVKVVREETWEAFVADSLLYAKAFLFAIALVINYSLALCYLVAFLVIFIIAQQPPYDGLGITFSLTPLQLESLLTEGNTSKFWLVEFRALCSSTYVCNSRIFPDLSVIYSNKNISFGIVDIGHFPNAAEKFGISLPGHIPTYILFENAVEIARLPEIGYAEISLPKISKKLLCQNFELDRRLIEYISS